MITSAIFCGFHLFFWLISCLFVSCNPQCFHTVVGFTSILCSGFFHLFVLPRLFHAPSSCRCSQYTLSSASQFLKCIMRGEEAVGGAVIEDAQVYASHSWNIQTSSFGACD